MTGSTISSTITNTVTLGGATYPSPLTITAAGAIVPHAVPHNFSGIVNGYNGVIGTGGGLSLINDGSIFGGVAAAGIDSKPRIAATGGGIGGIAVDLTGGGALINSATIAGGSGGAGGYDGYSVNGGFGGAGGAGVVFGAAGSIVNTGSILGGTGGAGGGTNGFANPGIGGVGGDGIVLTSGDQLTNSAIIVGGAGGAGGTSKYGTVLPGVGGGTGLVSNDGSVLNTGHLTGGAGGRGASGANGGGGGVGGTGTDITAGVFTNGGAGVIQGGKAGLGGNTGGNGAGGAGGIGGEGVRITGGTFVNQGTVTGGAFAYGGVGHFGNGALGTQGIGVYIDGGTIIDTGAINEGPILYSDVDSVKFGSAAGTLEIGLGAHFQGEVQANASVADVLEFGTGAVVLGIGYTGFGGITGFNHLSFATGASATAAGTVSGFDAGQVIAGFAFGDTLSLDGFTANPADVTYVAGIGAEIAGGGGTITLDITGTHLSTDFKVTTAGGNTAISLDPPCFAAGTRILTTWGEIAVEHLCAGDAIVLTSGETAPVIWLGHRRIDLARHPHPERVCPVLIEAGAIADGVPVRDLLVSPDHALLLEGHLIPAKALINGYTIRQVEQNAVTYYHVELAAHAVLYAEGTPAESYLETGNRGAFENGGVPMVLHPDFAQSLRDTKGCAPLAVAGRIVERVRRRLLARAAIITTGEPAVTIRHRADGAAVIESRSAIPGHITHDPRDCRRLGIKIAALSIGGIRIPIDHPDLTEGWHDAEPDGRWTDGAGVVPAGMVAGAGPVEIEIAARLVYPLSSQRKLQRPGDQLIAG